MVYVMMISVAMFMAILPFGVFLGLGSVLEVTSTDPRLMVTFFLAAAVLSYGTAFGAFALIQNQNCGSVKNMKQIANNAGIAFGIQAITLLLVYFIPGLRGIVSSLLPPDTELALTDSLGYSYFSFWAALFGIAVGGTLSGSCP